MTPDLTPEEWDLILWALDYCTSVAQEMHDDDTGIRTYRLSLKIKAGR
jgi:hypothetical protein